jgi:transposase
MADTLELCRWTYNETLAVRKNAYEQEGKSVSYYETKKLLPQWKEEKPKLKGVHRCPFCGLTLDRDHNAALNILRLGLQSVAKA